MPNVEVTIPNLVPGKRYRMVIEPNNNQAVGPSIEFKVPNAPRLISTYRPTYRVLTTSYPATGGEIIGYTDVYGDDPPPYTTSSTTDYSAKIDTSTFRASSGWYKMNVTAGYSMPGVGQEFYVSGASGGSSPYYYDWLKYTVSSVSSRTVYATAVPNNTTKWSSSWKNQNGKPFGDIATTVGSKAVTISWSVTTSSVVDPSAPFIRKDPIYSAVVPGYTVSDVELTLPPEINSYLTNTTNIVDVPIFLYIKNGTYYYFNDIDLNSTKSGGVLYPPTLSSKPSPVPLTAKNRNVNADVSNRDYRFTIARYENNGSSWSGYWLQTDSLFVSEQNPNKIILSQSGTTS